MPVACATRDVAAADVGPAGGGWADPAVVVSGAADVLAGVDVAAAGDVAGLLAAVNRLRAVVDGLWVRAAGELDRRGAYAADRAPSAGAWLRGRLNTSRGTASAAVTTARRMEAVPLMTGAFMAGEISYEHLRAVTGQLVNDTLLAAVTEHDATFLELARRVEPKQVRAMVAYWAAAADPEGAAEGGEKAHQARRLSISDSWEGRFYLDGQFDAEGGETIRTAVLAAMSKPAPGDGRTAAQRRADALVDVARFFLDAADLGESGGERPHVTLTCDLDTLLAHRHAADGGDAARGTAGETATPPTGADTGEAGTEVSGRVVGEFQDGHGGRTSTDDDPHERTGSADVRPGAGVGAEETEHDVRDPRYADGDTNVCDADADAAGDYRDGAAGGADGGEDAGEACGFPSGVGVIDSAGDEDADGAGDAGAEPSQVGHESGTAGKTMGDTSGTVPGATADTTGNAAGPAGNAVGAVPGPTRDTAGKAGRAAGPAGCGAEPRTDPPAGRAPQHGRRVGRKIGPAGLPWLASFPAMFGLGASFAHAGPAIPATAERYLCDCALTRVLLAGRSEILDVGRARRLFTKAQRKALAIRDQGCVYPYCDRPPALTDAHHILPWEDGGPTDLANAVLLCRYHHRCVHEGGETLTRDAEGRVHVVPGAPRRPCYRRTRT